MIAGAVGELDGPAGWLNRSLGPQTIEVEFDSFDELAGDLPFGPVISIAEVSYLDATAVWQPMIAPAYELLTDRLVPAIGSYWPNALTAQDRSVVRVRYRAGYAPAPDGDPDVPPVPAPIVNAILVMVGSTYRNRDEPAASLPQVEAMLAPFRRYR